ncbi:MAG TPA: PAS domain S-box protein [Smithella sp.]|nr:PAS domain S-box protein [Smithella sp.]
MFCVFPKDDYQQTLRIKRFLMAFASYLIWYLIALFAFLLKLTSVPLNILVICFFGIVLTNFSVYGIIRTGLNKKFKDPSLTLFQMVMATFWTMVFVYYAGSERSLVLLLYLVVFVFGLFRLKVREFLFLSLFAVIAYAAVILLHYLLEPESINTKTELLNLIVLAMVLPWFSVVGGYISKLRTRIAQSLTTSRVAEVKFRTIFDSASDGMLLMKISDKRFYSVNKKMCELTGYTREEILQLGVSDLHDQTMTDFVNEQFQLVLKEKKVSLNNIALMKKDKSLFFADISASVIDLEGEEYLLGIIKDITERKQAEETLKQSEQQYRLLADHMKDQVWLMDFDMNVSYVSPSVERVLGYTLDELKAIKLDKLLTPESFQAANDFLSLEMPRALAAPDDYVLNRFLELEFICKDGLHLWGECMFSFIRDKNGKPVSLLGEARDITERKKMEDKLRFEEERFRALVEHSSDITVLVNLEGIITYINPAVEHILGYKPEERIGRRGFELIHPDDQQFVAESFITLISDPNNLPIRGILRLRQRDGRYCFIEAVGSALVRDGIVEGVILNYRDITERKKAEEQLHLSEQRYRTILEDIQEGYFEVDLAGNFTFFNDTLLRVSGYSREELMGMNNRQYTDEEELKKVYQAYHQVYTTGEPNKELVWKIRTKDGSLKYIEGSISLLKDSTGKPTGFRGIARDITERILMEKKLQDEENRFRIVAEQSSDIIVILNRDGIITYENPAVEKILGLKREERIGTTGFENLHPDDFQLVTDTYKSLLTDINTPVQRADLRFRHADGSWRIFETVASNLIHDNVIEGVIINFRDVTERKKAEEMLRLISKAVESSSDAIGIADAQGNHFYQNQAFTELFGYTVDELKDAGVQQKIYADQNVAREIFATIMKGESWGGEVEDITKTGRRITVLLRADAIKDDQGKIIGLLAINTDITERKKTEEEVFKLASIVRSSSELVNLATLDERMIFLNDAGSRMLGIDPEQVENYSIMDVIPEQYASKVREEVIPALLAGNNWEGDLQYRNVKTGALTDVHALVFTIRYASTGAPIYLANVSLDITERKQAEQKLQLTLESLKKAVGTTIQVLVSALESRDPYTAGHQSRVAHLACAIAEEMKLTEDQIEGIRMAGAIHDIGKLSVPAEILTKPSKLTKLEFSLIKQHSSSGFEMLKDVASPWPLAEIVHQHHERINGTGYPRNLKGDEILIESRILAVADVVESMASHRPYRASLGVEAALEEIEKNKGILYDTNVVDACLNLFLCKGYQLP